MLSATVSRSQVTGSTSGYPPVGAGEGSRYRGEPDERNPPCGSRMAQGEYHSNLGGLWYSGGLNSRGPWTTRPGRERVRMLHP